MAPTPIRLTSDAVNLAQRHKLTTTVAASPTAATETIIASLTVPDDEATFTGVRLDGWAAFTVGGSGVSARLRLRQTNASGTTIADSGAVTVTAGNLVSAPIMGLDTSPVLPGQVYVLTLTVGSAASGSTVSAVCLAAVVV